MKKVAMVAAVTVCLIVLSYSVGGALEAKKGSPDIKLDASQLMERFDGVTRDSNNRGTTILGPLSTLPGNSIWGFYFNTVSAGTWDGFRYQAPADFPSAFYGNGGFDVAIVRSWASPRGGNPVSFAAGKSTAVTGPAMVTGTVDLGTSGYAIFSWSPATPLHVQGGAFWHGMDWWGFGLTSGVLQVCECSTAAANQYYDNQVFFNSTTVASNNTRTCFSGAQVFYQDTVLSGTNVPVELMHLSVE